MAKKKAKNETTQKNEGTTPPPPKRPARKKARGRQGDATRPVCRCGRTKRAVSTPPPGLFTWYQCPAKCVGSREKVMRPALAQALGERRRRHDENPPPTLGEDAPDSLDER